MAFRNESPTFGIVRFEPTQQPDTRAQLNGAMWYDVTANQFKGIINGVVSNIGGSTTPTTLTGTNSPGVFTSSAMNEPFLFSVGTGCNPLTIYNLGGSSFKNTDGLAGCVTVPSSGVTNGFSSAVAGYAQNNNTLSTGQFGGVSAVGVAGWGYCAASNGHCWGLSASAGDAPGNSGNLIIGVELDVQINNNTTTGFGALASFRGNGQPPGDSFPAYYIQAPQGTGTFTSGFDCQSGSIASNTFVCLGLGKQVASGASNSLLATFTANDGTSDFSLNNSLLKSRVFNLGGPVVTTNSGIYWGATVTFLPNQLVKIDTAHNNAMVLCTTTDTSCDGFVEEVVSTTSCQAGSAFCPVITISGSKATGILGTGTCTVGQFVVVDTTTNGRIKCQAGIPAQGAYIGKAMSAQAVVGNTVDILTKFQ